MSTETKSARLQKWSLLALVFAGCAYLLFLAIARPLSINLDGAMYLDGATRLLQGGLPYIDFADVNPPLAYYLHVPPALLSQLTGIGLTGSFTLLLMLATLTSCYASYRLLTLDNESDIARNILICIAPALLLLPLEANFDLGQRSHLLMLAGFPYLLLRLSRNRGLRPGLGVSLPIGFCAGVALALKPAHYVAIIGIAEIYLLLGYRNFRTLIVPETLAIVSVALLYGLFMLGLPTASSEAFFKTYLPLVLESYDAYASSLRGLIQKTAERVVEPLLIALACGLLMRNDSNRLYRDISVMFLLVALAATAVFLVQQKGWAYHAIPIWFSALVTVCCLLGRILPIDNRFNRFVSATPVLTVLTLALLVMSYTTKEAAGVGKKKVRAYVGSVIEDHTAAGDTIYIMSTSVDATYPLILLLDRRQATRFPFLFPVPLLYDDAEPDPEATHAYRIKPEREQLEQEFLAALNGDLAKDKPKLILVETYIPCLFCPEGMTLPTYIESHSAQLPALQNYENLGWTSRFEVLIEKTAEK